MFYLNIRLLRLLVTEDRFPKKLTLLRQHTTRDEPDARALHLHGLPLLGLVFDPPRWNPNTARATERARPRGPTPSSIIRTAREALQNLQAPA